MHRFRGRAADGPHHRAVPVLLDPGDLGAEAQLAALGHQFRGPVRDQLVLRVNVVPAPAAQRGVVEQEGLPAGPELAPADPHAAADDRAGQAMTREQLDRAVLDHAGLHPGPEPVRLLPFQQHERDPGLMQQVRGD